MVCDNSCLTIKLRRNREIWQMILNFILLQEGHIDMLSSDHSPSEPKLKLLDESNFLKAWGGISSLQVGFSIFLVDMWYNLWFSWKTNWIFYFSLFSFWRPFAVCASRDLDIWEKIWNNLGAISFMVEWEACKAYRTRIKGKSSFGWFYFLDSLEFESEIFTHASNLQEKVIYFCWGW